MNRLALLLATTTFLATAQPTLTQNSQSLTFAGNPGICMVRPLAEPRLVPGTLAWVYRDEIRAGTYDICANFNGAFTAVTWNCRNEDGCDTGVMVDRTDGKIYWFPARATEGYEYHGESDILVVNAFISSSYESPDEVPTDVWRSYYKFSNGEWILRSKDKGFSTSMD